MPFARTRILDSVLNWFGGTSFPAAPATIYLALFTTSPTDNTGAGAAEIVNGSSAGQWNGYARVAVTTSGAWNAISGTSTRSMTNAGSISFGTAAMPGGGSIVVLSFGIYDASTAGNFLGWGTLAVSKTITDGDVIAFAAGSLTLSDS